MYNNLIIRFILAVYLCLLTFLSLNPWYLPSGEEVVNYLTWDKIDHVGAYAVLTVLALLAFYKNVLVVAPSKIQIFTAILLSTSYGILLEIAQSLLTQNRSGSVGDAAANMIGAVLGYSVFLVIRWTYVKLAIIYR